ncbi:TRIC cation channel family protein [Canibacter sp. lx-72]|nr:TRIC cation channel family protein [Canibacter zhuwentaonis]MBT1035693.1 TRIC cation channel family protein [Canibacter zhuwentaonis]
MFAIHPALESAALGLGSLQGALFAATFKRIDLLGVALIAVTCGVGGGILRDTMIDITPAAFSSNVHLLVAITTGMLGMLLQRMLVKVDTILNIFDALSLGAFAAIGTTKALAYGLPVVPSIMIGTFAAVGGGILRDIFLNLPIAAMHVGSFYAIAAVVGCTITATMTYFNADATAAGITCVIVTAALRLLAMFFGWSLPEQRAFDRKRRRKAHEVEETIKAIRTHTIKLNSIPDINPQGPNATPRE